MQSLLVRPKAAIIRPCGSLNAATATEFQRQLTEAVLSDQNTGLLIDLSQVDLLDSAGLMALVSTLNLAKTKQKSLSLCSASVSIRIVLELTQLDRVFEIFDSFSAFELSLA